MPAQKHYHYLQIQNKAVNMSLKSGILDLTPTLDTP